MLKNEIYQWMRLAAKELPISGDPTTKLKICWAENTPTDAISTTDINDNCATTVSSASFDKGMYAKIKWQKSDGSEIVQMLHFQVVGLRQKHRALFTRGCNNSLNGCSGNSDSECFPYYSDNTLEYTNVCDGNTANYANTEIADIYEELRL